ncbi:MAG: hypothetical protein HYZ19_00020 [Rhodocyclales bacterium]|nr:hypothetical protein [Rhodocyclales bacterium]
MNWIKLGLALALLGIAGAGEPAWADRGHGHRPGQVRIGDGPRHGAVGVRHGYWRGHRHRNIGIFFSAPLVWSWPSPYYYYPPVVVRPAPPPVYIEQGQEAAPAYWHYCAEPKGYYPYVQECPGGWQRVPPSPPQ